MSALLFHLLGLALLVAGQAWIVTQSRTFEVWASASGLGIVLWGITFTTPLWWLALLVWLAAILVWRLPGVWRTLAARGYDHAKSSIPPLSDTDRAALEAGTPGWESRLFESTPRQEWEELLQGEPADLTPAEQAFLDGPTERLCGMLDDWDITSASLDLSAEAWQLIRDEGFFGMVLPERYGGLGFSARAHSEVVMKIASRSVTAAVTVMVPNSLGPGKLLLTYGTEEQKQRYLPALAQGREIPCFGLTGPKAGSDAASIPDTGVVVRIDDEGEERLGVRLNWDKRYITLAPVATLIGLAVRLYDPDGLLGSERDLGITLVLVPADTPGVEIGRRHLALQVPFMNGPITGRDVTVGIDQVIGGAEGVGQGWRMLMECLGEGRAISLPALSVAAAKFAARESGAYARIRRQFSLPIARFEGVQELLAQIAGNAWLVDALRTEVARLEDVGACSSVASAIAKHQATERMRKVANAAMDLHAGAGICIGPRNRISRIYEAVPIAITVEGSNILTRNLIIFGQGLVRCHPHLLQEMECLSGEPDDETQERFSQILRAHVAGFLRNLAASMTLGLGGGPGEPGPSGTARTCAYHSAVFSLVVDTLLFAYGGALKRNERLSGRLADLLSAQYLSVCAARQYRRHGSPEAQRALHDRAQQDCMRMFRTALSDLLSNIGPWPVRALLRLATWTWKRLPATDATDRAVAEAVTRTGAARASLCAGLYRDPHGIEARLEDALEEAEQLEEVRRALRAGRIEANASGYDRAVAEGVLTEDQARSLRAADARVEKLVAVDAFAADSLRREPLVVDDG